MDDQAVWRRGAPVRFPSARWELTFSRALRRENGALGIDRENMASQKNLTYTRDLNEALSTVESDEMQCAFILNPTRVEEIGGEPHIIYAFDRRKAPIF